MRLRLVSDSLAGHKAQVWIDGELRKDVMRVELAVDSKDYTRAVVTYLVTEADIDVETERQA